MSGFREAVPIQDFLQSGHLSQGIVFLQDEVNDANLCCTNNDGVTPQQQIIENVTRVALLLSRSFVDAFCLNDIPITQRWSSIHLDDFLLDFELHVADTNLIVVLRGMNNFSPTEVDLTQNSSGEEDGGGGSCSSDAYSLNAPMQVLGNLLYTVFSQGNPPVVLRAPLPSEELVNSNRTNDDSDDDFSNFSRFTQRSRTTDLSVFTRLVDCDLFPISICRLLSDMIDIGPLGNAEAPFASFEDVLQDLERMISRPQIFLHDSYSSHGIQPHRPVFGRSNVGRAEEILPIMDIAVRMEESVARQVQSSSGNDNGNKNNKGDIGIEVVFVKGIAGSGKSHLVTAVGDTLLRSSSGWIVTTAKFERSKDYASTGILLSMFDKLLSHIVRLKEGGTPADIAYCDRVSKSILDSIGSGMLYELVGLLPSIPLLFPDITESKDRELLSAQHLVYPLSKLIEAFLEPGQLIMLCCDDLQWANKQTIDLMSEVLINIGGLPHISQRCLFIGMYRSEEVDDDHPLEVQKSLFHMSSSVNMTDIEVTSLSRSGIIDMVMTELKLPQRMVVDLADTVFKKSSGHAIFVVELLNSLLNDSIIAYSPIKKCYTWDADRIDFVQTGDNVAELIASNILSMPQESQMVLQIISCFGIQIDDSLLQVLEQFHEGIVCSIDTFVEQGLLDRASCIVIWAHDLILQTAYENLPLADRQVLHFKLGQFLGEIAFSDEQSSTDSLLNDMKQLNLREKSFFSGNQVTSTLGSLACQQIDLAGDLPNGDIKFSQWNLLEGEKAGGELNFSAALHYYKKGISFLVEDCWKRVPELSLGLHKGAVKAAYGLSDGNEVVRYADILLEHLQYEDVIESEYYALSYLALMDPELAISRGFEAIPRLNIGISIPSSPTEADAMNAIDTAYSLISQFSTDDLVDMYDKFSDAQSPHILGILQAMTVALWPMHSPLLPFFVCETVKYSLKHGIGPGTSIGAIIASVGWFKLAKEWDFAGGEKMANNVRAIIASRGTLTREWTALFTITLFIDIWHMPLGEIELQMRRCHEFAIKDSYAVGDALDVDIIQLRLHGGREKLSFISQTAWENYQRWAKIKSYIATWVILDLLLLAELTGDKSKDYFSELGASCHSLDDIKSQMTYVVQLRLPVFFMLSSYWKDDLIDAEKHSQDVDFENLFMYRALDCQLYVLFCGLVAFQRYRQDGGSDRLEEGIKMLEIMAKWARNSMPAFKNKLLLLQAEHNASVSGKSDLAEEMYNASIKAARDNGIISEVALANELFGNFHATRGRTSDASKCYVNAHVGYMAWGATAIADKLLRKHNLVIDVEAKKRSR